MKKLIFFLTIGILLMLTGITYAETTVLGEAVNQFIIDQVIPILGALILALIAIAVRLVASKLNIQVKAEHEALIDKAATAAVSFVEEKAAKYAKNKVERLTTGKEKLDLAITYLVDNAPRSISKTEAKDRIESVLGRLVGVGASKP